ncbi:Bax inhibitor-1 family protein [Candidatus Peregrinibacteria bacterium]|nr:Bax inhibitor-1 family protein [Candidatus Peregrinibacteria bacterium]
MQSSPLSVTGAISLTRNTESQVYALFAFAMALTVFGVLVGIRFAPAFLSTGAHVVFLILELLLIMTARFWMDRSPLNYLFFAAFPTLSGITVTPYILMLLTGYANGGTILLNALSATVCMSLAAAIVARSVSWDLGIMARALVIGLIGLLVLGIFQLFVPALRTTGMELALSGAGIVVFSGFLAYDLQRIAALGRMGANPFLLAISLYLDIFNLFLSILRFMTALSGSRR